MSDSVQPHELEPARLLCLWGYSGQEYWSGLLYPPSGDLPNPGIETTSPSLQADALLSEPTGKPIPSPGDLLYPEIESESLALQAESLPAELQGKPHGYV